FQGILLQNPHGYCVLPFYIFAALSFIRTISM
ncbi:MAG: hypothetical protein RL341_1436, partial [Pseudomonadota bacterium]